MNPVHGVREGGKSSLAPSRVCWAGFGKSASSGERAGAAVTPSFSATADGASCFSLSSSCYMRVSTEEQRPDRQIEGLQALCDELHVESLSALSNVRPVYDNVLTALVAGDEFVVWDMDRAYRSTAEALIEINKLARRGVRFRIANFPMDYETPEGYFMLTMLSAVAEYERRILIRRTKEGLAAARHRGVKLGRPRKLSCSQVRQARVRLDTSDITLTALAEEYGVRRWTLSRALKSPPEG